MDMVTRLRMKRGLVMLCRKDWATDGKKEGETEREEEQLRD